MIWALILIPALAGAAAFLIRPDRPRRAMLVLAAAAHAGCVAACWADRPTAEAGGWLQLDAAGLLFLTITSALFLAAAVYAVGFLRREGPGKKTDFEEGILFVNAREATFTGCLLLFLATMTLVTVSQHFGLLWVAVEATTLVSAPLITFHRHHRSLEATWKYLLICSVGIALALLGNFFLAAAATTPGGGGTAAVFAGVDQGGTTAVPPTLLPSLDGRGQGEGAATAAAPDHHPAMTVAALRKHASALNLTWLKAAFLLFLVGYGTKMGLAPLHTWLPDAHSEAPSVVSSLLSGALLNCAFLALLRVYTVVAAAGLGDFARQLLILLGVVSMVVAAVFIISQTDFKRMLAYSSVEHMGILALGIGLGGAGAFGSLLHAINHSMTKGMLFMAAGNILAAYRTKQVGQVGGVLRTLPVTGVLWVAGFLAITGSPPFGTFLSELTILKAAFDGGHVIAGTAYAAMLVLIFVGMASIFLRMAHGRSEDASQAQPVAQGITAVASPIALAAVVLALGLAIPEPLSRLIHEAAASLGI